MTLWIAGWSGQALPGGAGLKPALLRDAATGRFASTTQPSVWHSEEEIDLFVRRGLLTRCELHAKAVEDGLVVYASKEFLSGGGHDRLKLDPTGTVGYFTGGALVFAGYFPKTVARELLKSWGATLISDATAQLSLPWDDEDRRLAAARVLDDTRRARYCISAREDSELRFEMFKLMAAATLILHQSSEPVFQDASIDISPDRMSVLKSAAEQLAYRAPVVMNDRSEPDEESVVHATDRRLSPLGRHGYAMRGIASAAG